MKQLDNEIDLSAGAVGSRTQEKSDRLCKLLADLVAIPTINPMGRAYSGAHD